jgi:hypothetical protein
MSEVIRFLEAVACDASTASADAYARQISELDVAPAQRQALLMRDRKALSAALEGRETMFCMVAVPDENAYDAKEVAQLRDGQLN